MAKEPKKAGRPKGRPADYQIGLVAGIVKSEKVVSVEELSEKTGISREALRNIGDYLEKEKKIRQKKTKSHVFIDESVFEK